MFNLFFKFRFILVLACSKNYKRHDAKLQIAKFAQNGLLRDLNTNASRDYYIFHKR